MIVVDNQRVLQYGLYVLGAIVWYVLWKFLCGSSDFLLSILDRAQPQLPILGSLHTLYVFVALGLTAWGAEFVRRNQRSNRFGTEVVGELRKVSWPNWIEVRGTTLVVLGMTFVVSIILWVFDSFYGALIGLIVRSE